MDDRLPPGLYIVATPIGNLGDITDRAAQTLRWVDRVLVEDRRVSARLLQHVGSTARMINYTDHTADSDRDAIVALLADHSVALISDAGTPLISDPGYKLVRAARAAGHAVHSLPGPCAAVMALTLAGLPTDRFLFVGFLPAKAKARSETIAEVAAIRASLLFYESGPRLHTTLSALAEGLGERDAAVARELTKLHEETVTGTLGALAERYRDAPPKGEIVIVVAPPAAAEEASDSALDAALTDALAALSPSRAAAEVAARLSVPRKRAYARALELAAR